jgi:hypothetical protein
LILELKSGVKNVFRVFSSLKKYEKKLPLLSINFKEYTVFLIRLDYQLSSIEYEFPEINFFPYIDCTPFLKFSFHLLLESSNFSLIGSEYFQSKPKSYARSFINQTRQKYGEKAFTELLEASKILFHFLKSDFISSL